MRGAIAATEKLLGGNNGKDGKPGRGFRPGKSGNPGGRPKGYKPYAIRQLFAEALAAMKPEVLEVLKAALVDAKRHLPALELAARLSKEIGLGSDQQLAGVTIVVVGVDPQALRSGVKGRGMAAKIGGR